MIFSCMNLNKLRKNIKRIRCQEKSTHSDMKYTFVTITLLMTLLMNPSLSVSTQIIRVTVPNCLLA